MNFLIQKRMALGSYSSNPYIMYYLAQQNQQDE